MPDSAQWLVFLGASALFALVPGPGILYVLARSLRGGRTAGLYSVLGNSIGALTHVFAAALGLSAVLAASATAFTAVKLAGAAYLIYLGIKVLRAPVPETLDENAPRESAPWRITAHAYAVTALNPKSIVFYVAFFPLFLSADLPLLPQVVVLGGTFLVMATVNAILYALLAGQVTRFLKSYRARKTLNRTAGGILLMTGGLLGLARRSV